MRPIRITVEDASGGAVESPVIPLDMYIAPFNVSLGTTVDGTVDYTVAYTLDDVWAAGYDPAAGTWVDITGMTGATADAIATLISPVTAIRITLTTGTGSVLLQILQAGIF